MLENLRIRACSELDEPALIRLNLAFMRETMASNPYWTCLALPSEAEMGRILREALATPERIRIFIAEAGGEVVAYANTWTVYSIWSGGKTLIIDDLYVEASHRKSGVGEQVMAHLIEHAREQQYRRVQLQAEPDNHRAHGLYRKLSFQEEPMLFFMKPL